MNKADIEFSGEQIPDFYTNSRVSLMFKILQDCWNNTRLSWKPLPKDKKIELAKRAKEYNLYKLAELRFIEREKKLMHDIKVQTTLAN